MASGTTQLTIQINTTVDGISRSLPATTTTVTHTGTGFVDATIATSDTAAVIPQAGITPKWLYVKNLSATATEFVDILNDTAVLTRIDPSMQVLIDVSQVATPATNLKIKANTAKTPTVSYTIIAA